MPKNIYDIMLNSTRMRIVQVLAPDKKMTATEICEIINDVPRTTLYRHINILLDANVLTVVEEKKIRGSLERTLALNVNELVAQTSADSLPQQAFRSLMNIYGKFERYSKNSTPVQGNNKIFFNNTIMMLTDSEFDQFLSELQALLIKYHYEAAEGRKPRDISFISAPPESERDNE